MYFCIKEKNQGKTRCPERCDFCSWWMRQEELREEQEKEEGKPCKSDI